MQFKVLQFLAFALFASMASAQSTSISEAMDVLTALREEITASQTAFWTQLAEIRTGLSGKLSTFYSNAVTLIDERIEIISNSDVDIRASLAEVPDQTSLCVARASDYITQTIEFAGFHVANCVEEAQNATDQETVSTLPDAGVFGAVEEKINLMSKIIVDTFISPAKRNVYLQYNEMESLASTNFNTIKAEIEAELAAFVTELPESWNGIVTSMEACFDETKVAVDEGLAYIANNQIPQCLKFS